MTDYGYLFALALALYLPVDPLNWQLERITITKHLPLLLALPPLLFTMAGARLFNRIGIRPSSLSGLGPLLTLSLLIVAGGSYARVQLDVENTFLIAGVYMWAAPLSAAMLLRCGNPERLMRIYTVFLMISSGVVFLGLAVNYGTGEVYHELEFLVLPLLVFVTLQVKRPWPRWGWLLFFLLIAYLFKKNTAYLTTLLVLVYLLIFFAWPSWAMQDALQKVGKIYAILALTIVLALLAAFIIANRESYLPTGNTEFRLRTYEIAWNKFLASPVWGTGFTGAATERFTGFDTGVARNVLPTHSDILDIMANGGLIGLTLWLWGLLRIARLAYDAILNPRQLEHPHAPYAHMLACMSLAAILTYAFNPIFLQPAKSMILWTNLGFLVGIALLAKSEAKKPTEVSP